MKKPSLTFDMSVCILIVLKAAGYVFNTYSNHDFLTSISIDKTTFIVSYTNAQGAQVKIMCPIRTNRTIDVNDIVIEANKKVVDKEILKSFKNITHFRDLKKIETLCARSKHPNEYTPLKLVRDFAIIMFVEHKRAADIEEKAKELVAPVQEQLDKANKEIERLEWVEIARDDAVNNLEHLRNKNKELLFECETIKSELA